MTCCCVCLCLTPAMCHASSSHCYLSLLSGTPSKYQLCTWHHLPASLPWIPHRDLNIFVVLPWLLSWGFPNFLFCFQTLQVFFFLPFYLLFILGGFSLLSCLCSFFILPASHYQLPLSAQFFGLFSAIHIDPSASLLMTGGSRLYLFLFSTWLWLTGQRSDLLLWVQLISQISAFHAATCLSSCILSSALPLLQSVPLKDKQPQNCICLPFAVSWNVNYHFHAVCISFPGWHPCPYPALTVLSHLWDALCVFSLLLAFLCWRNSHKAMQLGTYFLK